MNKSKSQKLGVTAYITLFWYSVKTLYEHSRVLIGLGIFQSIFNGLSPIVQAYLSGQFIFEIAQVVSGEASLRRAALLMIAMAALTAVTALFELVKNYIFQTRREFVQLALRRNLLEVKAHYKLDELELPETQENFNLAESGSGNVYWYFNEAMGITTSLISVLAVIGVVLSTVPLLVLPLIVVLFFSTYVRVVKQRNFRDIWDRVRSHRFRSYRIEDLFSQANAVVEVKLFNVVKQLLSLWLSESRKSIDTRNKEDKSYLKFDSGVTLIETGIGVAADIWLLIKLFGMQISIATFEQTRSLISTFIGRLNNLGPDIANLIMTAYHVHDYFAFLHGTVLSTQEESVSNKNDEFKKLTLQNVSYKYPGVTNMAISNISLEITKGQHIAIVGANGAGKSTLIKLLLGMYLPTTGSVIVNETVQVSSKLLANQASIVMQDFSLFDFLTVGESVGLSDYPRYNSDKVWEALNIVGLKKYIDKIGGLEANFGQVEEDGVKLSGGQNQRMAIARVLYANRDLLIMDEPTSMIDAHDEQKIVEKIIDKYKDKTLLLISHRASTIKRASRIIVLKNGEICEEGTHKELYKQGTEYHKLFSKQIEAFQE